MKYLITGKNGQLAQEFIKRFAKNDVDFLAPDELHFDITDLVKVSDIVESYRPDIIINCAAYNFVDKAEQEPGKAFRVNAEGPRNLALAAKKQNVFLVHFGSDYVFDGSKENGLYCEDDVVNPLSEYGRSKLAGEKLVREETDNCLILRLSWVFGAGKQNFIYKLSEWSNQQEYLKIACDEFSVPTYTGTVVDMTMLALQQRASGLFHMTNSGFCSRYEWSRFIHKNLGISKFIRPVSMDIFNLPAKRPKFSAMSNALLAERLGVGIPSWEEGVQMFLQGRKIN